MIEAIEGKFHVTLHVGVRVFSSARGGCMVDGIIAFEYIIIIL